MVSSFHRLSLEVLIIILRYAPDLSTIYNFICASASANIAFNIDSPYILDAAIERSIPEFKHEARMIAILGTFLVSSNFTFESLVDEYKNLPKEVPSYAFMKGTPGPRYLVLTASRIKTLQHICFIYFLYNVHEALWRIRPNDSRSDMHKSFVEESKANAYFQAVAWWSLSEVEKTRIVRAYWKLIIYWNIKEICPNLLKTDNYELSKYMATIKRIDPCIGPPSTKRFALNPSREVQEIRSVLHATRDFLGCFSDSRLFTPFTSRQSSKFKLEKWAFTAVFKENPCWRFEEPRPVGEFRAGYHHHQNRACINRMDATPSCFYWSRSKSKLDDDDKLPDHFGLCIWDTKRIRRLELGGGYSVGSPEGRVLIITRIRLRRIPRAQNSVRAI